MVSSDRHVCRFFRRQFLDFACRRGAAVVLSKTFPALAVSDGRFRLGRFLERHFCARVFSVNQRRLLSSIVSARRGSFRPDVALVVAGVWSGIFPAFLVFHGRQSGFNL